LAPAHAPVAATRFTSVQGQRHRGPDTAEAVAGIHLHVARIPAEILADELVARPLRQIVEADVEGISLDTHPVGADLHDALVRIGDLRAASAIARHQPRRKERRDHRGRQARGALRAMPTRSAVADNRLFSAAFQYERTAPKITIAESAIAMVNSTSVTAARHGLLLNGISIGLVP